MSPEFRKVEALLALGRAEEAVALLEGLPARANPSPTYYRLRGRTLRASGRLFDAEAAFREGLALAPQEPSLLAELATTLYGQRRMKDALPYAREAVTLRPDVAAWHCLVGVIAESLEQDAEAERAFGLARVLAPTDAGTHTTHGWLLLRQDRVDAAEEAFRQALANDPGRPEALRGLARCALRRGDWSVARARWLETLSADPLQKDAQLQRALVLGHPAMGWLRLCVRQPILLSVLFLLLAGLAWWWDLHGAISGGLLLLAISGPASRVLLRAPELPLPHMLSMGDLRDQT